MGNLKNRNVRISENYKKTSTFYHKIVIYAFHSQNLIKIPGFLDPEFFRIFRIRFFSGYKTVRGLAGGQTIDQNAMLKFLSPSVLPVIWWQKLADMKNAKN